MSVPAAYLVMVIIWTTTPLAIKWSSEGVGPWLGVSARMQLGVFVCLVLIAALSRRMRWYAAARNTYLVAGLGIWGAMSTVYWGAQFIPSGMVSVVFGLSPVITGLLAALVLKENVFTRSKSLGMVLGTGGLALVFAHSLNLGAQYLPGLLAVLASAFIHSVSSVWIKRIGADLHPLETTTGALLVAVPLFWLTVILMGIDSNVEISERALWATVYLGAIATAFGFVLYFYVLREISATALALAALFTPVLALMLGIWLNQETISHTDMLGTAIILLGLASFQWGDRLLKRGSTA
ncbi:MAG: DMT family transporter [bacterium]